MLTGIMCLSACNYEAVINVNEDGTFTAVDRSYMSLEEFKAILTIFGDSAQEKPQQYDYLMSISTDDDFRKALTAAGEEYTEKEINGVTYYGSSSMNSEEDITYMLAKDPAYIIEADRFVYQMDVDAFYKEQGTTYEESLESIMGEGADQEELEKLMKNTSNDIIVSFPEEIVFTNGTLSEDKKTVMFRATFEEKKINFYAYTKSSDDIIGLSIGDAASTKKSKIKVVTNDKIKSITVNGKTQKSKKISLSEDGEYLIEVVTKNSKKSFTIVKDSAKPAVTGVESGKTYTGEVTINYTDEESGIKAAKLNGKKIKNGKKVTKSGSYTLKVVDKAGNKTVVKFTVE